ncbi:MAG: thiamine phosphate synthase [Prevotella sp.]|nr:thiamine phosphate synthase [Prevotella sp.]
MKLIIMTSPTYFVEEDKILETLFEEGMEMLHLNKPDSSPVYAERLLSLLPEEYHKKIVVHDNYYLKNEYGLAGIHLDEADAEAPQGYKGKISRTCRSLEELKSAKKQSKYVFLRDVFDSISDANGKASFSYDQLKEAAYRGLIDKHVYALGGVRLENIKVLKELGFGGAVICNDLWTRFDIHNEQDYRNLIIHFTKLYKAI